MDNLLIGILMAAAITVCVAAYWLIAKSCRPSNKELFVEIKSQRQQFTAEARRLAASRVRSVEIVFLRAMVNEARHRVIVASHFQTTDVYLQCLAVLRQREAQLGEEIANNPYLCKMTATINDHYASIYEQYFENPDSVRAAHAYLPDRLEEFIQEAAAAAVRDGATSGPIFLTAGDGAVGTPGHARRVAQELGWQITPYAGLQNGAHSKIYDETLKELNDDVRIDEELFGKGHTPDSSAQ